MYEIFKEHRQEIEMYCEKNSLSADKVFSSPRAYNERWAITQYVDLNKSTRGLLDETPAPITLKIFLENGKLRFEQTDITRKYLAEEEHVREMAFA